MCGTCGILSTEDIDIPINELYEKFFAIKYRGPEKSICISETNYSLMFHRLAINDRGALGDQPFSFSYKYRKTDGDKQTIYRRTIYIVCNGEIYNSKELKEESDVMETTERLSFNYKSKSDCEVLLPLFLSVIREDYYDKKKESEESEESEDVDRKMDNINIIPKRPLSIFLSTS